MRLEDFDYELPPELIAQRPLPERSASRLLVLDEAGGLSDRRFRDLPRLLAPGDLLVFNDTRVMPARLLGRKETGGAVEVLVERITGPDRALAHVRASKAPRPGTRLRLGGGAVCRVAGRAADLFALELETGAPDFAALLERHGQVPLPPYIRRPPGPEDRERYQTVYARVPGAVAAPTAGLHFDEEVLAALEARGIERAALTLHVGAGTFQPVRGADIGSHRMHAERLEVPEAVCEAVARTRARGGRVVAVGTTVVRALESAAGEDGVVRPLRGETRLFIRPGHRFRAVDALVTNFHLPRSTLLMLVCAFGGHARVMAAYRHAVARRYRFYSYGDAMLLLRPREDGT